MTSNRTADVALVTGAPQGIGAAACHRLAADGMHVAVNYRPNPERAKQAKSVAADINRNGGRAIAVAGDVTDPASVQAMFAQTEDELGEVTVLVCNAAKSDHRSWTEIDVKSWDYTLAVNLTGAFLCARRAITGMAEAGHGRIITLGSVTSELGTNGAVSYITSKSGLIGFTRSLSREVGTDGVTVNCLMPGAIRTELELRDQPRQHELAETMAQLQALPRRGLPTDIAAAISFLAGPDASFITGQVLTVDGGWIHY